MSDLFEAAAEAGTYEAPVRESYRSWTRADLAAVPWNGLTAVSLFSGGGLSSTGLKEAGFRIPYAVEFIPEAAATYRLNYPDAFVDERDIRDISGAEILRKIGLGVGELHLLEGSPPCSPFSSAGSGSKTRERACDKCGGSGYRGATIEEEGGPCTLCGATGVLAGVVKAYSDSAQRTDDLFLEYVRLVDEIRPWFFLAENVPGLVRGDAKEYAHRVTSTLSSLGYVVTSRIMNAAHYGAATERERLIFLGLRRDLA